MLVLWFYQINNCS